MTGTPKAPRCTVLGVSMTCLDLDASVELIVSAAGESRSLCVSSLAVHGLVLASRNPAYRSQVESFAILAADGHPVRWLINGRIPGALPSRVSGTDLMERLVARCAAGNIGVYLYGSTPRTSEQLKAHLLSDFPGLLIKGCEPSVFRRLSPEEDAALVHRINESGARIAFLGLGCPLQEQFAFSHRDRIQAVQVCVGAAFDFLAREKRRAPRWMQACALEWLYRLIQEPRRLSRRYFTTNTLFIGLLIRFYCWPTKE